ncbi:MAG: long-chain fatty acid--CoA ligase [Bdellovibrionales bacterium]|nr:long-chain fatty acid--CoA ligase [Bdellovibrionales bacterium]
MTPELDWLKQWSVYAPKSVALQSGDDGRALTYQQMFSQATRLAHVLKRRFDIQKGDRVAVLSGNELEYISLFFALQRLGAILVPVNFRFTAPEVEHILRDSGAKLLIAQEEFAERVAHLQVLTAVWSFEDMQNRALEASTPIASRLEHELGFMAEFEDACMILYTSGTTGFPKGAVISHRMVFWNSINTGLRLNLTQNDVVLTFLPLFHTGGWNVLTTPCLHRGAKVVLLKKFDPELVLGLCGSQKVSVLFGVPTTMDFLRRSPDFADSDLRSVRYAIVGGEAMPLELIDAWEKRGIPIRQGYGLTEFGPNVFSLNEEDSRRKMGSIGFPNFYIEARVVDEAGRTQPDDEVGELVLRGPVAMTGYWNNSEATEQTLRDGWLHTGDLVRRDSEGYFYVVGRKKEMFISGGENVYPAEVEKVLRQFPGVREVAVIGVPHPKWGECGRAFVTVEESSVSEGDLRSHCLGHLAKFKVPSQFVFLPELPKTESGKIAKKLLPAH